MEKFWAQRQWKSKRCRERCASLLPQSENTLNDARIAPSRILFAEHFSANVRPKFLQLVGKAIPKNQESESTRLASRGAIRRHVINVGKRGGSGVSHGLGNVEAVVTGIRARDEQPLHPVIGALPETAFAHLVVAGILVEQARENRDGHVRADTVVGKIRAITLAVRGPALAPFFGVVFRLGDRRQSAIEWIRRPIKHGSRSDAEFVSGSERRNGVRGFDRAVIRQHFENAVVNRAGFFFQLALSDSVVRLRRVLILARGL